MRDRNVALENSHSSAVLAYILHQIANLLITRYIVDQPNFSYSVRRQGLLYALEKYWEIWVDIVWMNVVYKTSVW